MGGAHLVLDAVVVREQCRLSYGVDFPTLAKTDVNGEAADSPYTWLKAQKGGLVGRDVRWHFTEFPVNRKGEVVARFAPATTPEKIEAHVAELLKRRRSRHPRVSLGMLTLLPSPSRERMQSFRRRTTRARGD